eukprot:Skav217240  [mRNA]  locus=scaffold110:174618:187868:+ [translate_table: standard]
MRCYEERERERERKKERERDRKKDRKKEKDKKGKARKRREEKRNEKKERKKEKKRKGKERQGREEKRKEKKREERKERTEKRKTKERKKERNKKKDRESWRERERERERKRESIGKKRAAMGTSPLHHPWKMGAFSRRCLDRGIAVVVVGNPAVPILYERVRFCISAAHTIPQLAEAITAITAVGQELGVLYEAGKPTAELEALKEKDCDYAKWLRNAPLLSSSDVTKLSWSPEPLCPPAPAEQSLLASLESACSTAEQVPPSHDFRLMDPLGYAASPLEAALTATEETMDHYGFGACGPRGFYGGSLPHLEVEAAVAEFLGMEAAITYSAGVTTVSSVIPALVQTGDRVIVDSEVHLGFRTGLRLCKAEVTWVPHYDLSAVTDILYVLPGALSVPQLFTASREVPLSAPTLESVQVSEALVAVMLLVPKVVGDQVDAIMGSLELAVAGVGGFCAGRYSIAIHMVPTGCAMKCEHVFVTT